MRHDWIEIRAKGPSEKKDEAALKLVEAGCPGVLEEDASPILGKLIPHSLGHEVVEETPSPVASCRAYLDAKYSPKLDKLEKDLFKIGWEMSSSPYKEEDWSLKWKRGLRPIGVSYGGSSVIVKPTWKKVKTAKRDVIVEIDPGMAFGTGGHPTTKMCLKAILKILKENGRTASIGLLDIGTGTGVLAIAAKKLKVKKVTAVDIDPVAINVARANARLNGVKISISATPVERLKGSYPAVASNILANELTRLSVHIAARVARNGFLILSGILKGEAEGLKKTYASLGLRHLNTYSSGEWAALVFKKAQK